jgi:MarR family transcriptional regulator, organic hydroperoxide resistance regulator
MRAGYPSSMPPSQLQREIQQSKPFRSPAHEAYLSILRTADHLKRSAQNLFEPAGLTEQQYNVLRILRGAGESGLPTLAIAERLIEHTPGITRLIDRLEAKNLVRRERPDSDRRQVYCFLSKSGAGLLASLDDAVERETDSFFACATKSELKVLIATLEKIRNQS